MSDIGMILERLGTKLVTEVAPRLEGDYAGGHAAMSGLVAVMAGEAWDGAADRLFVEIGELRALLQQAGLGAEIPESASLKISDLTIERNALNAQLVALQAQIETREDEPAKALNAQIWVHLLKTAQARMPSPPSFPDTET